MSTSSSSSQWHKSLPALAPPKSPLAPLSQADITALHTRAASLHSTESASFSSTGPKEKGQSEAAFFSKIVQTGTLSDRLSALTLLVQASPVHNTQALETLRGMAERGKGKGGREEALKALRCISDWWVGGGAPDRKLKYFRDQPLSHPNRTDAHLVLWYFEDWLKKYFFNVLQTLETLSLDPLPYVRTQSLTLISTLLRDKPEQEHNLLRLLVNKLGDPEKSIASRASYHILQVLQSHPSMKSIFVREISSVVFHSTTTTSSSVVSTAPAPNKHIRFDEPKKGRDEKKEEERKVRTGHVQYYSVITLNQIALAPGDQAVALQLINIYFDIFRQVLGNPSSSTSANDHNDEGEGEGDGKTGDVKVDSKGRIHNDKKKAQKGGKKGGGKKGGGEEAQVKGAGGFVEVEDANARLVSAILTGVNRALPFAKLGGDENSDLYKHIDTLFVITHKSSFNTSLQALVLIQQIASTLASAPSSSSSSSGAASKKVVDRYFRTIYASLHDPRLATSSKQAMYLNLLFKTLKQDTELERVKAVVRRFTQVLVAGASGASEFVAGGLYLLGELFSTVPGLRAMVNVPAKKDVKEGEEYDAKKRDPLYAHAGSSPLWELTTLLHHHHPAIALHARQLLTSQPLTAHADLSQNTLSHFLDRFVYKNAKQLKPGQDKGKGPSAMQPAASGVEGVKLVKGENGLLGERVNDKRFVEKKESEVAADEMFFYKYFKEKKERDERKRDKVEKRKGGDESSGSDDEEEEEEVEEKEEESDVEMESGDEEGSEGSLDEDEVWKAMQASMPKANGDEDLVAGSEDEDEFDSADMESDDGEDEDADEEGLSLVEGSDNEDLVSLNGDVPDGLIPYDGSDSEEEEWGGIEKKRKRGDDSKEKRKKLKSLPTFASYEDYAKLIEASPEDSI